MMECGRPGTAFSSFDPASIALATSRVLDRFDYFAMLAYSAALRWPERRGPARVVGELMSWSQGRKADRSSQAVDTEGEAVLDDDQLLVGRRWLATAVSLPARCQGHPYDDDT